MLKVEAKNVSLNDLKHDVSDGFVSKIYRFTIEVPLDYLQRRETGPLMSFNVSHKGLYEFMLGAKRAFTEHVSNGTATISVEVGEAYLNLALRDLKKVEGAIVLIPESKEETGV